MASGNDGFYRLYRTDAKDYIVLWWESETQRYLTSSKGMHYLGPVADPTPLTVKETRDTQP